MVFGANAHIILLKHSKYLNTTSPPHPLGRQRYFGHRELEGGIGGRY